jgi:putative Mg2+ transporter-C (MgtC) family protein
MESAALRLVMAALLSAVIGFERELTHKAAGLRTHMLVGLGAALFTIVGQQLSGDTRIPAQVVTGVGFLGAGAIFREGMSVKGLTTAAGLWTVAAIGMSSGAGFVLLAVVATAVALAILFILRPFDRRLHRTGGTED